MSASNGTTSAQFYYDGKNRQIARNINGVIRFSAWDNWELVEEYSSGLTVAKGYLQGATGVIKSWDAIYGQLYYYQDKLGSTTHVANAIGQLLESYHYDLTGTPTETSTHGVVDLYAGERWIPELTLYDLRNRMMSPELGRFLQADPIGFKGDASNLYRYCGNDPIDRIDPTGLYARGSGWSARDWSFFEQSQAAAAEATEQALAKTERALANGGKAMEEAKKAFEKAFGPGSATTENLARMANLLQHMLEALRDDGLKGYYANAAYSGYTKSLQPQKGGYTYSSDRKSIYIVVDNPVFRESGPWGSADQGRQWVMTHESSHNFGTGDQIGKGTSLPAYKLAHPTQFQRLPNTDREKALQNADTVTSFVYP